MAEFYGGVADTGLDSSSKVIVGPFKDSNSNNRSINVGIRLGAYYPPKSISRSWSVSSRTSDVTYSAGSFNNYSGRSITNGPYSETQGSYTLYFPKYKKGVVSFADVKGTINGHTALVRFITEYETRVNTNLVEIDGAAQTVSIGLYDTAEEAISVTGKPSWISITTDEGPKSLVIEANPSPVERSATLIFEGSSKQTVVVKQGKALGISATPSKITGAQRGGTAKVTLEITGSGVSVASATSDSDWATVDKSGNVTYTRNPDKTSRTATLTFTGTPSGSDTVKLVQEGSKEIKVYCNRTGAVSATVNETWLSVNNNDMTITATNAGKGKTGTMTFTGEKGGSATLTIKNQLP